MAFNRRRIGQTFTLDTSIEQREISLRCSRRQISKKQTW